MPTPCEALATAAEVQELREQLNELLGKREDGSKAALLQKGKTTQAVNTDASDTLIKMARDNAPVVLTGIAVTGGTGTLLNDFAKDLVDFEWFKGNGTKVKIPEFKKLTAPIGKLGNASKTLAKSTKIGAGGALVIGQLAVVGGTLALNKKTVDVFDQRMDAEYTGLAEQLDVVQNGASSLYQKHQGDINNIYTELENRAAIIANQQASIQVAQRNINDLARVNQEQNSAIDNLHSKVIDLQSENNSLVQEINALDTEFAQTKTDLTNSYNEIKTQLEAALIIITSQRQQIVELQQQVQDLEAKYQNKENSKVTAEPSKADFEAAPPTANP